MSWAIKRRLIIGSSVFLFLLIVSSLLFWNFFYVAPSCSDGVKNGDEKGIDCGGSCQKLCTSDALDPVVLWTKIFNVSGDVYSVSSLLENPNINSSNQSLKYKFSIYDTENKLITIKEGETVVPKGKKFAIFEGGIVIKDRIPKYADIEFISFSNWIKSENEEPSISLKYGTLVSTSTVPRINGTITNDSFENIKKVELNVFVLDGNENVVATSRTFVENLNRRSSQEFVFTWPKPFNLGVESCVNPLDVVLVLDRSGSMRSEGLFPPEPFNTVKKTAESFVKNLTKDDSIGVISFGDNSRIESGLSRDKNAGALAIENLFLSTTTIEQTNIRDGLRDALVLLKDNGRNEAKKSIILLTDGIPTFPIDQSMPDFPSFSAIEISKEIKNSDIRIFTIGLGKNVSEGFLKTLSSNDTDYFFAPNKETLGGIYSGIASSLCPKKPNVINVIYKVIEK